MCLYPLGLNGLNGNSLGCSSPGAGQKALPVLDEIQKVQGSGEVVKRLWDEERRIQGNVLPILLESSAPLPCSNGAAFRYAI